MSDAQFAAFLFLQLAFILAVCRGVGLIARRFGQPQVVAEMVAGFLIGPSFFGWLAPDTQASLFPPEMRRVLFALSQVGLVLYMFCVGLEFRADLLMRHARKAMAISLAGILAPFALGGLLGLLMLNAGGFFSDGVRPFHAVLFVGSAMSITAFPMLARIIYERGISGTALGTMALAAGAMDDAVAWILLAVVIGSFSGAAVPGLWAAVGGAGYAIVVFTVGPPLLGRLAAVVDHREELPHWALSTVLAVLALGAWFTDLVGIYSVFGAFVLGAAIPRGRMTTELQKTIEPVTTSLLLPIFFVYSGLNTQLGLVDSAWLWTVTAAVFAAACIGKGAACWFAARLTGASSRDALGVATLMNARGLMELILLNIGLQRGLITPTLFTIMVLMAIATTVMAYPLFGRVYRETEPELDNLAVKPA
jgi:Kef-type K+ transport system membrane component KefB